MTTVIRGRDPSSLLPVAANEQPVSHLDEPSLRASVDEILNRRPAVGLALGVVRDGRLAFFHGHGLADIAANAPITEDTVFRIGSITKLVTAIAVMQLVGEGRVDTGPLTFRSLTVTHQ
jgi:CubicO group peptidase (beta-lactamase class C family)